MDPSVMDACKGIRVICHVDLDAFYAQVEAQAHPHLDGKPLAVLQYNPFGDLKSYTATENRHVNDSNGSIIALSYGTARDAGVKRGMRASDARKLCAELQFVQVPTSNGKADLASYRHHGQRVLKVLAEPVDGIDVICEKASIDESYLDITAAAIARLGERGSDWSDMLPSNVDQIRVGFQGSSDSEARDAHACDWFLRARAQATHAEKLLAHGAAIIAEKRALVHSRLGFTVSAGMHTSVHLSDDDRSCYERIWQKE